MKETDLIERKKILDFCNVVINRQVNEEEMNVVVESFKAFAEYVKALPSEQPKNVQCKNCKYFFKYSEGIEQYQSDGFCADDNFKK